MRATDHAKIRITTVLIAVAKLESTCATPTFASTAVSPAKTAESKAQVTQFIFFPKASVAPASPPAFVQLIITWRRSERGSWRHACAFWPSLRCVALRLTRHDH